MAVYTHSNLLPYTQRFQHTLLHPCQLPIFADNMSQEWFAPLTRADEDSPPNQIVGAQADGSPSSAVVTGITYWFNPIDGGMDIPGMEFQMSDGTSHLLGSHAPAYLERRQLDIQLGERIRTCRISKRPSSFGITSRPELNGFEFTTDRGRTMSCVPRLSRWQYWQNVDVGSGLLMGAQCTRDCMAFSFCFLKPVATISLEDVS